MPTYVLHACDTYTQFQWCVVIAKSIIPLQPLTRLVCLHFFEAVQGYIWSVPVALQFAVEI